MEMTTINGPVERRKNNRFSFQGGAFVYFNSKPPMAGRIIDISEGGLAFTLTLTQNSGHTEQPRCMRH
jgi:hypothetical protein